MVLVHPSVFKSECGILELQLATGLRAQTNGRIAYLVTPHGAQPKMRTEKRAAPTMNNFNGGGDAA